MKAVMVGLASGLGNCVHMLPAIKALHLLGCKVNLFVQGDFPMAALWERCRYAKAVYEPPSRMNGCQLLCGQWRPASWNRIPGIPRSRIHPPYMKPEWSSNMKLARDLGWNGGTPDVSDWCRNVDRTSRWDIGIVPGCKGGTWIRKRYPGMAEVAGHFGRHGKKVAVFGQATDGVADIPGDHICTPDIAQLPDALAGCRVIVGTDSGVTHLANSLGIPTVVVHTASCPVKATPVHKPYMQIRLSLECSPCQSTGRWHACGDWKCREIDPREIIDAVSEMNNKFGRKE